MVIPIASLKPFFPPPSCVRVSLVFFFLFPVFIGVLLIYNVVLVSGIPYSESVIYVHVYPLFFRFFSHISH